MAANGACSEPQCFADPLPEVAEKICAHLVFDGQSLLRLGAVNGVWRRVVGDPTLWKRLNVARFGSDANEKAALPARPAAALPGWCFFPGVDSDGNNVGSPEDAAEELSAAGLAARAERLGAVAFNTQGWIKSALLPISRWNRYSYVPGVGMYVKEEAVARTLGSPLPPPLPEHAEPAARPPDFPGWVFFQMVDSPGCDLRHPANGDSDFTSTCTSLSELDEVASRLPTCVAFNTEGHLKHNLHPQVRWRPLGGGCSWSGLYVREDVVAARGLRRPQEGVDQGMLADPCLRHFQLARTRLLAARDVDVTWLNESYLQRVEDPEMGAGAAAELPAPDAAAELDADGGAAPVEAVAVAAPGVPEAPPPPPVEVVKLSHVCWLDLRARFYGVGPGRYRCVWVLRVARDCNVPELNLGVNLRDARRLHCGALVKLAGADTPVDTATTGCSAAPDPVPNVNSVLNGQVISLQGLLSHADSGWYRQPAGVFSVPAGWVFDVEVGLWNHGVQWKGGLMFRELLLEWCGDREGEEAGWSGNASGGRE